MSLSVNSAEPGQYVFPASASVPANGYLVVWCDGSRPPSITPGNYNTGHSLDGESGGAYLFNAQGQVINSVEYGFQVADRPIGLSGGQWRLLATATPGAVNAAPATLGTNAVLRINEWMANPTSGPDWFELFNPTNLPVELGGLFLTDDPSNVGQRQFRVAPLSFIGPAGFAQWIADGDAEQGRDHVNFSLDAGGESLWLFRSPTGTNNFTAIDSVAFDTQLLGVSEGRLPDGQLNLVSFPGSATPAESNYLPLPGVVINEVLTHTDAPLEDAVELRNTGASAMGIGGWFLSDSQDDFKKYRISDGTSIAGGGFAVIYQNQFSNGTPTSFTFDSAHGDEVWLSAADAAGNLTGYRAGAKFGAAQNGVSFGRVTTSVGVDYAAASGRTLGVANAAPLVGPVVINELMYHPQEGGGFTGDDEYLELRNVTGAPVALFDAAHGANTWKLAGGVNFVFAPGVTLGANAFALVVPFDPANSPLLDSFRAKYGVSGSVPVHGPYSGSLNNAGEAVELLKPDLPQPPGAPDAGFVPYVIVDKVEYGDSAPWPAGAVDGGGLSLQRQGASYGNEPLNWRASLPTPGAANGAGIVPAPVITGSPQGDTVVEGEASTLAVSASGAVPIGYQWRFNGTPVPSATNATFALDYVVLADDGDYDCVVSNPGGAALSASARLSVQAPTSVVIPPASVTNRAGSNITFTVIARGSAPVRYQWRLNGVTLPGATNATLTRTNIQFADDGEYDVTISNPVNATMASARLVVLINPVYVKPPVSTTVVAGSDFTMSAEVSGNPMPFAYSWRRGSIIIATNSGDYRSNFITLNTTAVGLILTNNMPSSNFQMRLVVYNQANRSPGVLVTFTNTVLADFDRDGIPDVVENELGLSPSDPVDAALDGDGDGMSNRAEYTAGTDPASDLSYLRIDQGPGAATVNVAAVSNRTYTVQFTDNLNSGAWSRMADIVARSSNRIESFTDATWTTNRFYRVVTPRQP
jgi:outer membrane lipoprotein SlyB